MFVPIYAGEAGVFCDPSFCGWLDLAGNLPKVILGYLKNRKIHLGNHLCYCSVVSGMRGGGVLPDTTWEIN